MNGRADQLSLGNILMLCKFELEESLFILPDIEIRQ